MDQLLAEIADSFEAVWHERTELFEQVRQLRGRLAEDDAEIARLRAEADRASTDREAVQAELERERARVRDLQSAMEQLEPDLGDLSAEHARLSDEAEALRQQRQRLLMELQRMDAVMTDELVDFLGDALNRVGHAPSNGSDGGSHPEDTAQLHEPLPFQIPDEGVDPRP